MSKGSNRKCTEGRKVPRMMGTEGDLPEGPFSDRARGTERSQACDDGD